MSKTQFYLSQCADAAAKSPMAFTLGAVLVKGGKVISSGYNHHRPHYDGADVRTRGHRKPVSMHAEMHAIFNLTGMSPSFRKQQGARAGAPPQSQTPGTRTVFNGPSSELLDPVSPSSSKRRPARRAEHVALRDRGRAARARAEKEERRGSSGGRDESGSSDGGVLAGKRRRGRLPRGRCWAVGSAGVGEAGKAWSARRRDPRVNGADIYVARVTKVGMGSARPCWRCVEWCRWAGVKRIFHWNGEDGKFDMVKVNTAERDQYETHADVRLFAGMGW
ncbi:hypothetical protein BC826DRAFT_1187497 [Russula brevipes]|nr:hypothetical protein BC826DRAFT_1187497 [Russula brevipes]